jgi:hypothetical protein
MQALETKFEEDQQIKESERLDIMQQEAEGE